MLFYLDIEIFLDDIKNNVTSLYHNYKYGHRTENPVAVIYKSYYQ